MSPARLPASEAVLEGREKVTGALDYISTRPLDGLLTGKIVRSTLPHATITAIDTKAAAQVPGVISVIVGRDVRTVMPDPFYGPAFHDQPVLALDRVRYVGEPVAVVLAADPAVARAAAELVEVSYEELPAVYDEVEAASDAAPRVHDRLRPGAALADLRHLDGRSATNIALEARVERGDAERALAGAPHIFTSEYRTQQAAHVPLESHVAVAYPGGPGRLTVHSTTQSPSFVRLELARLLGWPEAAVRVCSAFLGGGFGAKLYIKLEPIAAACALLAGRPVRIALTMEEQFVTISRHATTTRITTGVDDQGRITARIVDIWWNGGAYADIGPRVTQKSGFVAAGPYDIPNVLIRSRAVYTNRTPAGAMRGFGVPQMVFAYESHTDEIAGALGLDAVAFRRMNLIREGQVHHSGTELASVSTTEALDDLMARLDWTEPLERGTGPVRRGRGIAIALKAVVTPTTSVAVVSVAGDGSIALHQNTVDMGQGSATVMAQIVGEVFDMAASAVTVLPPDTDTSPYDMGTLGSRSTFHMGNAVRLAAMDARRQLQEMVAQLDGGSAEDVLVAAGMAGGITLPEVFAAFFGAQAGTVVGRGMFTPRYDKPDVRTGQSANITAFWMVGACGAEVSADVETGRVTVDRLVNVGDVGTALNPGAVLRQMSGGTVMQLGMTMSEEMVYEDGQLVNAGLGFYKLPSICDVPVDLEVGFVGVPHPDGPFGAKGMGETGTLAVSPAIANALADAAGVRVRELPLTPERVFRSLRANEEARR